jgi:hypothetical protein
MCPASHCNQKPRRQFERINKSWNQRFLAQDSSRPIKIQDFAEQSPNPKQVLHCLAENPFHPGRKKGSRFPRRKPSPPKRNQNFLFQIFASVSRRRKLTLKVGGLRGRRQAWQWRRATEILMLICGSSMVCTATTAPSPSPPWLASACPCSRRSCLTPPSGAASPLGLLPPWPFSGVETRFGCSDMAKAQGGTPRPFGWTFYLRTSFWVDLVESSGLNSEGLFRKNECKIEEWEKTQKYGRAKRSKVKNYMIHTMCLVL